MAKSTTMRHREKVHAPKPRGVIDTRDQSRAEQVGFFSAGGSSNARTRSDLMGGTALAAIPVGAEEPEDSFDDDKEALLFLNELASRGGNIAGLLAPGVALAMGEDAVREYEIDKATRSKWEEVTERGLLLAEQESDDDEGEKNYPFEGASDVHYPILTTAALQFQARAMPALVKGDKVAGVKVFTPPPQSPSPLEIAQGADQPTDPNQAQAQAAEVAKDTKSDQMESMQDTAAEARGKRVAIYLNWNMFYQQDNWEGETDLLLMEMSIAGIGFKKVYKGPNGPQSDYVSAMRLVVNNSTKSLARCPRITQEFDIYPYEIEAGIRAGKYTDVRLPVKSNDPEASRVWIEQHTMRDLDGDGLSEPYIITVDLEERRVMRIEPAYTRADIVIDEAAMRVKRIDRYVPFPTYVFLPSPRGHFYGMGLAKLLDSITDSVDTTINQLIDAGNAEIAGGGFIGSQVRLQGSGQSGSIWFKPGEYQTVSMPGADLRAAIWERTVPSPSAVSFQMLELLLAAAKDISSVKDVITGDTPATAPVGTTMALQDQALTVFNAIYKRIYRGFKEEFQLLYQCCKRYADDAMRAKYKELTGGDFDEDFESDGTDIKPVADPNVVTKMQKTARLQALMTMAESEVGQAAGMTQFGPASEIVKEGLDVMDIDRPERFITQPAPNPDVAAKTAVDTAKAGLLQAQTLTEGDAGQLDQAKTVREMGLAAEDAHKLHGEAERILAGGSIAQPPEGGSSEPSGEGGASPDSTISSAPTGQGNGVQSPGTSGA